MMNFCIVHEQYAAAMLEGVWLLAYMLHKLKECES